MAGVCLVGFGGRTSFPLHGHVGSLHWWKRQERTIASACPQQTFNLSKIVSQNSTTTPAPGNQGLNPLRWILVIVFLIGEFALISVALRGAIPPDETREVSAYSPWSEEVLKIAEAIPVQEGGRIKPLRTYVKTACTSVFRHPLLAFFMLWSC